MQQGWTAGNFDPDRKFVNWIVRGKRVEKSLFLETTA
jgi:hypothetical protein